MSTDATDWLPCLLRDEERAVFDRDGYLLLPAALCADHVQRLQRLCDELVAVYRPQAGYGSREERAGCLRDMDRLNLKDCAGLDAALLELLSWPSFFPKVCGLLSWNIQLYHSQLVHAPGHSSDADANRPGWHRDSGRLNSELETDPQPRISVKVGMHLSDALDTCSGNMWLIPGSHLWPCGERPTDNDPRAMPVRASAGDAVIFDRRIWHRGGVNTSAKTRRMLFYGYSYRWLRPRSELAVALALMDTLTPLQRQLMAVDHPTMSASSPLDEEVPLKQIMAGFEQGALTS